jgi:PiT family inorganic phosphate transporter
MDAAAAQMSLGIVLGLVLVALAFDFMNGFHDAANSIATVVSTRVLKPYQAVLLAAFFNFAALFVFAPNVATTVGRGIVDQGIVDQYVVLGALISAIAWDLITWWYGIPSWRAGRSGGRQGGHVGAHRPGDHQNRPVYLYLARPRIHARRAVDAYRFVDF